MCNRRKSGRQFIPRKVGTSPIILLISGSNIIEKKNMFSSVVLLDDSTWYFKCRINGNKVIYFPQVDVVSFQT